MKNTLKFIGVVTVATAVGTPLYALACFVTGKVYEKMSELFDL